MSKFEERIANTSRGARPSKPSITRPVVRLEDYFILTEEEALPSMFRANGRNEKNERTAETAQVTPAIGNLWRPIVVTICLAILGVVAFHQLYRLQGRIAQSRASMAASLAAGSMEEVILAASARLYETGDDKSTIVRRKNDGKRSANEKLIRQLKAWVDKSPR